MSFCNNFEYIAIDFETANSNLTSACAIGIVGAKNGKIILDEYYLINPNEPFSDYNILIHHITPNMVKDEKTFPEVWELIKDKINGETIVCHNAMFDIAVLKACLEKYDLEMPNIRIGCTLKVSRIAFKDILPNCKLNTISSYLEVNHNHHNADSDAQVCFYLLERVKRMYQAIDIEELFEIINLGFGILTSKFYKGCYNKYVAKKTISNKRENEVFAYCGKPKLATKTEIKKLIEENGGFCSRFINKGITSFIIFTNPPKGKLHELEVLQEFKKIKVLNETEFFELLKDKDNG